MTAKEIIAVGLIMGCVAAAIVWALERFEVAKLHSEVSSYLGQWDAFKAWEASQGGS